LLGHPTFLTIAKTNNLTPEQTVYKLAQLQGITPLSGTTQVEHMRQDLNVEAAEWKEDGIQREVELVKKLIE
jgi:diketogulonate reductase-like aldo/keto reductase